MAVNTTLEQVKNENAELKMLQQVSFESTNVECPRNLQDIMNIAKVMSASGILPDVTTAQKAAGLMIFGRGLGLSVWQSLTGLYMVQGKPMLAYPILLAKVREHPRYDYEIDPSSNETKASVHFFRDGKPCGTSTVTIEEARTRKTQNLDKIPGIMLIARATGDGVRRFCPDVFSMNIYAEGEMVEAGPVSESSNRAQAIKDRIKGGNGHIDAEFNEVPPDEPDNVRLLRAIGEEWGYTSEEMQALLVLAPDADEAAGVIRRLELRDQDTGEMLVKASSWEAFKGAAEADEPGKALL